MCLKGTGHLESLALSKLCLLATNTSGAGLATVMLSTPSAGVTVFYPSPTHIQVLMMTLEKAIQIP